MSKPDCGKCGHPVHNDRFECGKTSPSSLGLSFLNICGCEDRDDSVDPDYEAALAEWQKGKDSDAGTDRPASAGQLGRPVAGPGTVEDMAPVTIHTVAASLDRLTEAAAQYTRGEGDGATT